MNWLPSFVFLLASPMVAQVGQSIDLTVGEFLHVQPDERTRAHMGAVKWMDLSIPVDGIFRR